MKERIALCLTYTAAVFACLFLLGTSSQLGHSLSEQDLYPPDFHLQVGGAHLIGFLSYPAGFYVPANARSGARCPNGLSGVAGCRVWKRAPVYAVWYVDNVQTPRHPKGAFVEVVVVPLSLGQLVDRLST